MGTTNRLCQTFAVLGGIVFLAGCHTDMWVQPKHEAQEPTTFFPDGSASRPLVPGTVARDHLREDDAFFTGRVNGRYVAEFPIPVTKDLILRGQERFNIYCSPCHGRLGDGHGMITQRGLALRRPPATYHTDRLRNMPVGHFYDVITNGYGVMFSYAARVEPQDRWAIIAYIRTLQLSQNATAADVPAKELQRLQNGADQPTDAVGGHTR